jgi:hypothetical protein
MHVLSSRTSHPAARIRQVVICCAGLLLITLVHSAALAKFQVSESDGIFRINMVMQMQVPAYYVHRVLTDYEHIYRLYPAIVDSEILPSPDDGVVRVRTRIDDCIVFFCADLERVEDVRELPHGGLQATIVPGMSNFKSGHAKWRILDRGEQAQVIYQAQMEPDFFILPLLGSYFVKRKLRKSMLASMERIECIARIQAGLEPPDVLPARVRVAYKAPTENQGEGAALLAGEVPHQLLQAPAAGSNVRDNVDCARPCNSRGASCQP